VRTLRIPHAETNATMLPHTMRALRDRCGKQMTALARALGTKQDGLFDRLVELGGGPRRLSELGEAGRAQIDEAIKAIMARPELQMTPDPPDEAEIRRLIETAW
jgi:alcohol dehydrogenase class IV